MSARKLAVYVHVDGVQYGPDDTVPADVAEKITNPDVWVGESDDGKPAGNASLEEWHAYALTQGADEADLEGKSRNDLRDQYK